MINYNAYPFLNDLNITDDVKRRLSIQLNRIELGNEEVYETPLGAKDKYKIILSEVDLLFKENSGDIIETLNDLELSNREKIGPRSIAKPWSDRKENVYAGFEPENISDSSGISEPVSLNILRPLDLPSALKLLKNNTNSGLPYYERKGKIKERILTDYDYLISERYPCLLFTRTQEGGKTRTVWGYPAGDTLREMRFYKPLLEYQKNQNYRAALLGPDEVGRAICAMVLEAQTLLRTLVSMDFEHYDEDFKAYLQKLAFNRVKSLYQKRFHDEIDDISSRFLTIGLVTPDGILEGEHQLPSGSPFTNEVGSIGQFERARSLPFVNENNCQVQGDDAVYLIPRGKEDELFRRFESCGLTVNKTKSYVSNDFAIYLQCLYHIDYMRKGIIGGIYPIYRALNRLCFQERWFDFEDYNIVGKDYYSIRALCILENCKYHPLFEKFVKLIVKHDKYSLDFTNQGLSNYVHMLDKTKGAEGILNNQYGDNIKGLKSFESYKLIKGLS